MSTPVYTVQQIRALEQAAIRQGIDGDAMMTRAGEAAFKSLLQYSLNINTLLLICGTGNNAGDAYVLAVCAKLHGLDVHIRYLDDPDDLKNEAQTAYQRARQAGIEPQAFDPEEHIECDAIVDAILGIGLKGQVRAQALAAINWINIQHKFVLSIDIPSGLCATTGFPMPEAVYANLCTTFIGLKPGLLTGKAAEFVQKTIIHDLSLSQAIFDTAKPTIDKINANDFKHCLKPRLRNAHKTHFGHVLIIGGYAGMSGAPLLSALAAARTGAGLISIAAHPFHAMSLSHQQPEIMCHGIYTTKQLQPLLDKATVVVVGPGLGQNAWSKKMLACALKRQDIPMIIDADALNLLAQRRRPISRKNWILTPHPGEAARLLKQPLRQMTLDRWQQAKEIQKRYGGVCILKGHGTIIRHTKSSFISTDGNPGMASGGMGDFLSGIIAALIAQQISLIEAANLGVCLHSEAADIIAKQYGERGMLATDLLVPLRQLVNPA
jgi:ADP-dependent NAD(P)H-hydrate dehydratase / NAD(P)H-hydrate epimerase